MGVFISGMYFGVLVGVSWDIDNWGVFWGIDNWDVFWGIDNWGVFWVFISGVCF